MNLNVDVKRGLTVLGIASLATAVGFVIEGESNDEIDSSIYALPLSTNRIQHKNIEEVSLATEDFPSNSSDNRSIVSQDDPLVSKAVDRCDMTDALAKANAAFKEATFWANCDGIPRSAKNELVQALGARIQQPTNPEIQLKLSISSLGIVNESLVKLEEYFQKAVIERTEIKHGNNPEDEGVWFGIEADSNGKRVPMVAMVQGEVYEYKLIPKTQAGKALVDNLLLHYEVSGFGQADKDLLLQYSKEIDIELAQH